MLKRITFRAVIKRPLLVRIKTIHNAPEAVRAELMYTMPAHGAVEVGSSAFSSPRYAPVQMTTRPHTATRAFAPAVPRRLKPSAATTSTMPMLTKRARV